jgi:RHS repeat-associated protein
MKVLGKLLLVLFFVSPAMHAWAGVTSANDPNASTPQDSSDGCACGSSKGMPVYSFKSLLAGLNIRDTPIGYTPPLGPAVETTITYNERETLQPTVFNTFNVGQRWTLNWVSWIQDNPSSPGSNVQRYVAGGGGWPYTGYNATTGAFSPEPDNGAVLVMTSASPITYELDFADGSKNIFAAPNGATGSPRLVMLTKIVDAHGNALTLNYDGQFRLSTVSDALGQMTSFTYGNTNPLLVTGITDPFGRHATLGYDSMGRLNSITDVIGMTSTFAYDSSLFIQAMTTPYGTTNFAHTEGANGNSTELSIQATDPKGYTERTEYLPDAPGVPFSVSQVPAVMNTFNSYLNYRDSFYWDKDAFAAACTTTSGTTTCDYSKARMKHYLHESPCCYYTSRVLENEQFPLEGLIWYDYAGQAAAYLPGTLNLPSDVGRVLDDGTTQITNYTYNANGLVATEIDPDGRETVNTYAPNGIDLIEVQQKTASGFDTLASATYNSLHEPLTSTDAAGETTTSTYNGQGQRTSVTDPLGNKTSYSYNPNGYLTTITNALGRTQHSFTYDSAGRVASDTDSQGYTRSYAYDALNRITKITYPDTTTDTYVWTKLDLTSVTDRQGNTTSFTYDADRNKVATTDPLGLTTKYSYYPNGKLQTQTDPKGNVTTWTRDIEGRVTAKTYADGHGDTKTYDNSSRLATVTDALGQTTNYAYDLADLMTGISYQNAVNPTANVSYSYDPIYPRLVTMTDGLGTTSISYGPVGRVGALQVASTQGPFSANDTVVNTYDALGRVTQRNTDQSDSFSYDALGREIGETNPLGFFNFSYLGDTDQPSGQTLTTLTSAAGYTLAIGYDANSNDRQLQSLSYAPPQAQTPSEALVFTHSTEHLLETLAINPQSATAQQPFSYSYDADYRLLNQNQKQTHNINQGTAAPQNTQNVPLAQYGYDAADNLTQSTLAQPNSTTSATTNNLNQLATVNGAAWQYDADGNLLNDGTFHYAWDAAHRLISVTGLSTGNITSFQYDGLGHRLIIDQQNSGSGATGTRYLWCGDMICGARTGQNVVSADYYPQGELHGSQALYYVKDQIGSVLGVMNASGILQGTDLYTPYGGTKTSAGTQSDFLYAGMLHNAATGLYLTQYREYNPAVGRWLNRDPIGELGGENIYAYVGNSPLDAIDPQGLDALVITGGLKSYTNPFGHVANAVTGTGVFSYGNNTSLGSNVQDYLQSQMASRNQVVTYIPTSPEQDAQMRAFYALHPGRNSVGIIDNCAARTSQALNAGGVPAPDTHFPFPLSNGVGSLPGTQQYFIPQGGPIPQALLNILPGFEPH